MYAIYALRQLHRDLTSEVLYVTEQPDANISESWSNPNKQDCSDSIY